MPLDRSILTVGFCGAASGADQLRRHISHKMAVVWTQAPIVVEAVMLVVRQACSSSKAALPFWIAVPAGCRQGTLLRKILAPAQKATSGSPSRARVSVPTGR